MAELKVFPAEEEIELTFEFLYLFAESDTILKVDSDMAN